jgi:sterol desaturase/sphingolipid hydroxylase (fatty acid hydroxylase superfamily)
MTWDSNTVLSGAMSTWADGSLSPWVVWTAHVILVTHPSALVLLMVSFTLYTD